MRGDPVTGPEIPNSRSDGFNSAGSIATGNNRGGDGPIDSLTIVRIHFKRRGSGVYHGASDDQLTIVEAGGV